MEKISIPEPITITTLQSWLLDKTAIEYEGIILRFSTQQFSIYAPQFQALRVVKELPRQTGTVQPYHFLVIARETLYHELNNPSYKDTFIEYFPQWANEYSTIKTLLNQFCSEIDKVYQDNFIEDSKKFAEKIKSLKLYWKPLLFLMKSNNYTSSKQLLQHYKEWPNFQLEKHLHLPKLPQKKKF